MTITGLRILPPFAIGRLGSASEPLDNYVIEVDPERPLGFRHIKPAPTLIVDERTGEIRGSRAAPAVTFKQGNRIRPVAPFLEVFAVSGSSLRPLTLDLLRRNGLDETKISWRVAVANRKVFRRTEKERDIVEADTEWFSGHEPQQLKGQCRNFVRRTDFVDFGHVRFVKPNREFPEIRLRFTPAKGLIYGPNASIDGKPDPAIAKDRAIYDTRKGSWRGFGADDANEEEGQKTKPFHNETLPPALYAIKPPAPPWLHGDVAISRGYLDDACDGFVEVKLTFKDGTQADACARVCAAPPVVVPDSLFVRNLLDDLEQVIEGPQISPDEPYEVIRAKAE